MVQMDFDTLEMLRDSHPAWRLLRAKQATMIIFLLYQEFIVCNRRAIPQSELVQKLANLLIYLREERGEDGYANTPQGYLDEWAEEDKGWLRKFYPHDISAPEPHYDLTPAAEKAITWIVGLPERSFVGTESRLYFLFNLLRYLYTGTQQNISDRIGELEKRKKEIEKEMEDILNGNIPLFNESQQRIYFREFSNIGMDLTSKFRQIEQNFRNLFKHIHTLISKNNSSKGEVLGEILNLRDSILETDEGRSFRDFWVFLNNAQVKEEFDRLLEYALELPAIKDMQPDPALYDIYSYWHDAGSQVQATLRRLSEELRRYIDSKGWLEDRQIMSVLRELEGLILGLHDHLPGKAFMELDDLVPKNLLPMDLPQFQMLPKEEPEALAEVSPEEGSAKPEDFGNILARTAVDRDKLAKRIEQRLLEGDHFRLSDLIATHPLQYGLAELIAYLQIAYSMKNVDIYEDETEIVFWYTSENHGYFTKIPIIIFNVKDISSN